MYTCVFKVHVKYFLTLCRKSKFINEWNQHDNKHLISMILPLLKILNIHFLSSWTSLIIYNLDTIMQNVTYNNKQHGLYCRAETCIEDWCFLKCVWWESNERTSVLHFMRRVSVRSQINTGYNACGEAPLRRGVVSRSRSA